MSQSPQTIDEIRRLRRTTGLSLRDLATRFDLDRSTISMIATGRIDHPHAAEPPLEARAALGSGRRGVIPEDDFRMALSLRKEGRCWPEIAKSLGCSPTALYRGILKRGLASRADLERK